MRIQRSSNSVNQVTAPFFTRRQLAMRWVCSIATLKRREKAGILPVLKLGRDVKYRPEDIERIEQQAEVRR
jgi:hypothetical protein